ncbi:MAG: PTS-dependent dihydroxyacetone kinase phosphotransferase subunit DhaM [Firmicutes bacterium]|nr:PTS-dependent dihydroxyacetone kinase phosphotransferase subunit DhaM [Bacillota bacterium]
MVGIVIVSHSSQAADGIKDIALQMADVLDLKLSACGGNKEGGIGTDPDKILKAVEGVYSSEGVVIIADLGSAVMCVEMLVEGMSAEKARNIRVADAPILEGAVMAAIEASAGADLESVLAGAEAARDMRKIERD